ncbi:MAG: DNA-binding transcriptional LysR family regulator [Paracoccaceae bacterium]|jgi:DNA-binding transcriptional LysR family regulator
MSNTFRHHDTLRLFIEVAKRSSFSEAAEMLHLTKGAISYQVKILEADLGFDVFIRKPRGVVLTPKGQQLFDATRTHYRDIETELVALKTKAAQPLTVGMSSYFASRWLSPRLMTFMQKHPDIQLRIQPMTQLFDLEKQGVDFAIRWGSGLWDDVDVTPFMPLPAWPVGNAAAAEKVLEIGIERAFAEFTLLRDHDDSNAWSDWFEAAGLVAQTRADTLIIPDPNVRVQAVIDGQGIALNDTLVARELNDGQLHRLSEIELSSYGYFLVKPHTIAPNKIATAFVDWLQLQ